MPSYRLIKRCLIAFSFLFSAPAFAQVNLPAFFSDNMVLQSGKPVTIWGKAVAGEKVAVIFGKKRKQTKTDNTGNSNVVLNSLQASSIAADLIITSSNIITIKNVLVGEVWICSGQSNMDMTSMKYF